MTRSMQRRRPGRRRGITLTEALISMALLSVIFVLAWQLYRTAARSATQTEWLTRSQIQIRNGLKLLREDIGRASYPSRVGPTSVNITREDRGFRFRKGRLELATNATEVALLDFYICKPERFGFGGTEDVAPETVHATLTARGNELHYRKVDINDPTRDFGKVLVENGDYILLDGPDSAPDTKSSTCLIEIKSIHDHWENTGVTEQTLAKIDVAVAADL